MPRRSIPTDLPSFVDIMTGLAAIALASATLDREGICAELAEAQAGSVRDRARGRAKRKALLWAADEAR